MARGTAPLLPSRARHLAERFTFGVGTATAEEVNGYPDPEAWFDAHLRGQVTESPRARAVDSWFPLLDIPAPVALHVLGTAGRDATTAADELVARTLALRVLGARQVLETMVDFWGNLLYVPAGHGDCWAYRADYERTVLRRHALGTYADLLSAATQHAAMTGFLSNHLNHRDGINENLGRELLELHTVGSDGGYDERDVVDSSLLLTGYTLDPATTLSTAGYDPARHATGRVRILDFQHANAAADGRPAVEAYLRHLALHPATARRLARRLCVRFVRDDPPSAMVESVAKAYLRSGSDIPATLRALVSHPDFQTARWQKVRKPSDDVVHMARVLGLQPTGAVDRSAFIWYLVQQANAQGQLPYRWPAPDGWPETSAEYLSAARMLRAWTSRYDVSGTDSPVLLSVDVPSKESQLPSDWPRTLSEVLDHQSELLLGRPADPATTRGLLRLLGLPGDTVIRGAEDISDEDYRLLRGTLLNSPRGIER